MLPLVFTVIQLSWPLVVKAYVMNEYSSNAGGLIRWPVFALLPLGFLLIGFQAVSELIKRVAFLKGLIPDPTEKAHGKDAEEELAEFLLRKEVAAREGAPGQAMIEFLRANMAPIMFASLVVFLLFGYSVAFSLGACGCSSATSASRCRRLFFLISCSFPRKAEFSRETSLTG